MDPGQQIRTKNSRPGEQQESSRPIRMDNGRTEWRTVLSSILDYTRRQVAIGDAKWRRSTVLTRSRPKTVDQIKMNKSRPDQNERAVDQVTIGNSRPYHYQEQQPHHNTEQQTRSEWRTAPTSLTTDLVMERAMSSALYLKASTAALVRCVKGCMPVPSSSSAAPVDCSSER